MPRPRKIVMQGITADEAHSAAIQKAIKDGVPYRLVNRKAEGLGKGWMVIYVPTVGKRSVAVEEVRTRKKAKLWVDRLSIAWAEGRSSSGLS